MLFSPGSPVRARTTANVRRTPGYRNKESSGPLADVCGSLQPGQVVTVIGDLAVVDDLTWYRVRTGTGLEGFVAERAPDGEVILVEANQHLVLACPVAPGAVLTQRFGENPAFYSQIQGYPVPLKGHNGLDWGHFEGAPILACDTGTVERSESNGDGFGEMVKIRHDWGESLYAHLSARLVQVGQSVSRGQQIGRMGNTGLSSGTHLHFGVRVNPYDRADGWGGFSDPATLLERV